jgi:hypothetical protein
LLQSFKILRGKSSEESPDFRKRIAACSNEELKEILRKRMHYIPEAAQFAIGEAIKRGIISSEQDLLAPEYRTSEPGFTWFPRIADLKQRARIRKSISRSLMFAGFIPTVFGLMEVLEHNLSEGLLIMAFGLLWMFMAIQLFRFYNRYYVFMLLFENLAGTFYAVYRLMEKGATTALDYFAIGAFFLLVTYGLLFMKLMRREPNS